ncbi:MAG TPA: BTAD domain-containing putative transcriptional regulator [Gemmatimonadaceae bacterium]|nr:BTAD domain-containing putative transcriptional regulator [Gemmatimonadaceae bacterium]
MTQLSQAGESGDHSARRIVLELRILGPLQLGSPQLGSPGGRNVESLVRQSKRAALLAYLAAAMPRGAQRRDKVLALFWPELDESHARAALNQALYVLRTALGERAIVSQGDAEVGLSGEAVWCDATAFEAALDAGRPGEALALYRGDLLDGFFVSGAPEFEHWVDQERMRLRERASEGAWALAEAKAAEGDAVEAGRWARRAADLLPADEAMVRRLMEFLNRLGDRAAAIRAYEAFAWQLAHQYELEPSAETQALSAAIRQEEQRWTVLPLADLEPAQLGAQYAGAPAQGVRLPDEVGSRGQLRTWWWGLVPAVLVAVALAGAAGYGVMTLPARGASTRAEAPRILVLPFRNLGAAEDAYFADGISDEITARLAMVPGLSVIGRQTALHYARPGTTVRQIAQDIDVDYVLEGTVSWQRSTSGPGRVRVRPQLIRARDETHVWAAVLDEDLEGAAELFALLSGISDRVVDELHVVVEASPPRAFGAIPTSSVEAYDDYLRGRQFLGRTWTEANHRAAIQILERVVARDPEFAPAYAWLSFAHTEAFWLNALSADHLDRAKDAGETALRLDPDLPDAHMAVGHYYYVCCEDYERALAHLKRAHAGRPGDARIVMLIGNVHKRQSRWEEAVRYYERAAYLDPRWKTPLLNLGQLQVWLRGYDDAERTTQRALSIDPQEAFAYSYRTWIPLLRDGDVAAARRVLAEAARASDGFQGMRLPFYLELLDRNYGAARALAGTKSPAGEAWDEWLASAHVRRAAASRLLGDSGVARVHFDSARTQMEAELRRSRPQSRRTQDLLRSSLAVAHAGLGHRSAAIEQAKLVLASDPPAADAISGPIALQNVALAYVLVGEKDAALDIIERLLSIPARFSAELLRLDPLWDPLRGHPRFERLRRDRR